MKIRNIMKKNVVTATLDESVSSVLMKMRKNNIHQVPVVQNGLLHGIIELKNIVTKNIDIETTKVGSLKTSCPTLSPEDDILDAARKFVQSGLRALPVTDNNNLVGIVSETDFLHVPDLLDSKKKIDNIMAECSCAGKNDSIGKIKKMMVYENISRVPICDNGKLIGTVGTLDMIKAVTMDTAFSGRGGLSKEAGTKEKLSAESSPAKSFMHQAAVVSSELSIKKASEMLSVNEELYIQKNGKVYIITPKDVLENIKREQTGVLVDITNIVDEDSYTLEKMHQAAAETVKKIAKFMDGLESLILRIERMQKSGKKKKYSVRARFFTPKGLFVSHAWGWDVISVTQECLKKLENEIMKMHEKSISHKKGRRQRIRL